MIDDIYVSLKSCDTCQRANDTKFSNIDAALHPIPVESKVWNHAGRIAIKCVCHAAPKLLLLFYILKLLLFYKLERFSEGKCHSHPLSWLLKVYTDSLHDT